MMNTVNTALHIAARLAPRLLARGLVPLLVAGSAAALAQQAAPVGNANVAAITTADAAAVSAPAATDSTSLPPSAPDNLYARMGGKAVVGPLVADLIDHSSTDPRTRRPFAKVDLPRLKQKVEEQICALAGGPCKYTGDSMKQSHAGLNITQAEFYGFVEVLIETLDRHHIGLREKNQLLAMLAPMKRDVVTK